MNGKSLMFGHQVEILEDADTIPSIKLDSTYEDEEPTIKIQVPTFSPQIKVENRYPGIGLIIALTLGVAMWFLPCYYFLMWVIFR